MSRGRSKPKSAPLKVRASSARTGKSVMKARSGKFRRTRSQRGNKRLKIAKQIRSAQIYLQNPFVYRYQGESIQYILPNQRTVYQGRMYNWHSHPDGGGVGARWTDFASVPVSLVTNGDLGFLYRLPGLDISSVSAISDRLSQSALLLNRWSPTQDSNKKIYMWPAKETLTWKNNSDLACKIEFYVFKALQDIPRKNYSEVPAIDVTDYSPAEMWGRGLGGGVNVGLSNLTASEIALNRLANVSDARSTFNRHWKVMRKVTIFLQPGDEATQYVRQPGKYIDLAQLRESMDKFGVTSYGAWALKGDLVTMALFEGQVVNYVDAIGDLHGGTGHISRGAAGTDNNGVAVLIKKEFKGVILPQLANKYFHFDNSLDPDQSTDYVKLHAPLPAISS